jgi:hypothetical protein
MGRSLAYQFDTPQEQTQKTSIANLSMYHELISFEILAPQ